jgi:cell division topological specificity factor
MSSLIERLKGRREPSSAEIAKERLKLVLVTDRSNLSPEKLEEMQGEIIEVIKRYIPIDDADVHIKLEQRDRKNYLVADIPLYRDHTYHVAGSDEPPAIESRVDQADESGDVGEKGGQESETADSGSQEN